jgi:SAM-dependent methyltransferase|tara:strand:+ start:2326 stop:2961 length:636 start_codon:yes stop_codon:yes gene_type:complete
MSFNKGLINHWDQYYKKDNVPAFPSSFAEYVANKLINQQTILEVGCGNGRDAIFLASQGHLVTGLDRSGEAIELCKKLYSDDSLKFFFGTITDIAKINKKKYDLIYSRFVIHAMSLNEEIKTLNMSHKLLSKDGQLFIECRSIKDPLSCKGDILSNTERIEGHYRRFIILEEFKERLVKVGFKIIKTIESNGLAKFGKDDPVVIRIHAVKA